MTDENVFEASFGDKLSQAIGLSLEVLYEDREDGHCVDLRNLDHLDLETTNKLFCYADGLEGQYHYKRHTGQCSLQATIDYDIAAEEARLDADIKQFQELLANIKTCT